MGNSDFEPIFCFVNSDNFFFIAIGLFFVFCFLGAGLYLYFLERRKRALRKAFVPTCWYCGSVRLSFHSRLKNEDFSTGLSSGFRVYDDDEFYRSYRCRDCGKEFPIV